MSNNNRQQEIREDGPEYRSVMMAAPLSAPPMPRSFAAPPPRKFNVTRSAPVAEAKAFSKTSLPPSKWTVTEPASIPVFYMLERSHVYVSAPVEVVADRITESLRRNNIAVITTKEDDAEDNCNVLRAETQDCVKFAVRLFTDQGMIVVEVQRILGCAFSFREASRAVLRAAKNESAAPKRTFNVPSSLPQRSIEVVQACVQDDFESAVQMIRSDRSDSQALGLESLEHMSRSCGAVKCLAKSVLRHDCLKCLFSLLETAAKEDDSQTSRKVMAILANALAALGPAYLAEVMLSTSHLKAESFLTILLSSLRDAAEKPHDACQAARCLQALLISSEVKEVIMEMRLMEVLESACSAGCNSHVALEQESRKLMAQLHSC